MAAFVLAGCENLAGINGLTPAEITYTVAANGDAGTATSVLTFTFSAAVTGLRADHISLVNGTGAVTKGALTGSGKSWALAVTVTTAGNITTAIAKDGIEAAEKTLTVYKAPDIAYTVTADGDADTTTTVLTFAFNKEVTGLTANEIVVAGVAKGGLVKGSGNTWTLAVTVTTAGNFTVAIVKNGIEAGQKQVTVYKQGQAAPDIAYTVTADGDADTTTSALSFALSREAAGLTAEHIILADDTGSVTKGVLSGGGASWTLTVTVTTAGTITVSINKDGIEAGQVQVTVYKQGQAAPDIAYTVTADGDANTTTTALTFALNGEAAGLTAEHIILADGAGAVTKGALSGGGVSWTLTLAVTTAGTITVSINKDGIEAGQKQVTVYKQGQAAPDIAYTVTADGDANTTTTALTFALSGEAKGLTAEHIILADGAGAVTKGVLSGGGASWTLALTVNTAGAITVSINKDGIEAGQKQVTVYKQGQAAPDITIIYHTYDASGMPPGLQQVKAGSSITLPGQGDLTKPGYTLTGWSAGLDGTGTFYSTGAVYTLPTGTGEEVIHFVAQWAGTVTYDANGASGAPPAPQEAKAGSSITLPGQGDLTKPGYAFIGWSASPDGMETSYAAGDSYAAVDVTLYAQWMSDIMPDTSLRAALNWLKLNAAEGGAYTITLRDNETLALQTLSYDGKTVSIAINGGSTERTVNSSGSPLFAIESAVTLTLDNNVTLQGSGNYAALVQVNEGGTLVMNIGSKVSGNRNAHSGSRRSSSGGGVSVSGGTFTMNGGTISDNSAYTSGGSELSSSGGGVSVSGGTFTMNGGTISGNSVYTDTDRGSAVSSSGGGVSVSDGVFAMNGGTISNNTAYADGTDASGCYARSYGGGVDVSGGTFTMSGGVISNNTITSENGSSRGGGVYIGENATFVMSDGTINGNTAATSSYSSDSDSFSLSESYGGGVFVSGNFTMSGGTIKENTISSDATFVYTPTGPSSHAYSYGGGVYVTHGSAMFAMNDGTISGNTATATSSRSAHSSRGGGVYVNGGAFTMNNGAIGGNSATNYGGGVFVSSNASFIKQPGGTIYGKEESDSSLKNTCGSGISGGYAVYVTSLSKRTFTAGAGVTLNSAVSGAAGGWDPETSVSISNITYMPVLGSAMWTLGREGRRTSPPIGNSAVTKSRINFTAEANAILTIQLGVSSESDGDWAFISTLDNPDAYSGYGYYEDSRVSGTMQPTINILVPTAGSHFVDIGYQKDKGGKAGDDCVWFKVIGGEEGPPPPPVTNVYYSNVSGGGVTVSDPWTLRSDGSGGRQSPDIDDYGVTKARVNFTATANSYITIDLSVSSESGADYAFISSLDEANARSAYGYIEGSRISGTQSATIVIPVSTAGSHFVDIVYEKNGTKSGGSDRASFQVIAGEEAPPTPVANITYYGNWTLESDGRRKSPAIGHNAITTMSVSFTAAEGSNSFITIQLDVSSQQGADYAFISTLNNDGATSSSGYYRRISGWESETVTIQNLAPGSYYVSIGYEKNNDRTYGGSDCAWFKVIE
jgi:uncharacterized repeat protein (TIGR02543 family)